MNTSIYLQKYLKYLEKNRSIDRMSIGLNKMSAGGHKKKILIVVDVQNCFFEDFGNMGWQPKTGSKMDTKEGREEVKKEFKKRIENIISDEYDMIVFSKDTHPAGHGSFKPELFPPHCINVKSGNCGVDDSTMSSDSSSVNTSDFETTVSEKAVDLSEKDIKEDGHKLAFGNEETVNYDYKISLNNLPKLNKYADIYELITKDNIKYEKSKVVGDHLENAEVFLDDIADDNKIPVIVRLNKGETCNFDAYSAFVYHVDYPNNKIRDVLDDSKFNYSKVTTGLQEFISKYYGNNDLRIDVCGLVTNICVVNTCIAAYKLFKEKGLPIPKIRLLNDCSLNYYPVPNAIEKLKSSGVPYTECEDEKCIDHEKGICVVNKLAADGADIGFNFP